MSKITVTAFNRTRLVHEDKVAYLDAEKPRVLPAVFQSTAQKAGCKVEGAKAEPETQVDVEEVKAAMQKIMDSGDESKLTQNGEPRASALKEELGYGVDADVREKVFAELVGS